MTTNTDKAAAVQVDWGGKAAPPKAVDWSKPIEAVHEDGRVVSVSIDSEPYGVRHDHGGCINIQPPIEGKHFSFNIDGSHLLSRWRIRNVEQPTLTSAEMLDRMEALVKRMATYRDPDVTIYPSLSSMPDYQEARAIVDQLTSPVDPDLIEAREIESLICLETGKDDEAKKVMRGEFDDRPGMKGVLAAIRRGRELEREGRAS